VLLGHGLMGLFFGVAHLAYASISTSPKRAGMIREPRPFLQLDRLIHEKGRLAIMSMLAASPDLSFTELRDTLVMTDGNLTTHIRTPAGGRLHLRHQVLSQPPAPSRPAPSRLRQNGVRRLQSTCWSKSCGRTGLNSEVISNEKRLARSLTLCYKVKVRWAAWPWTSGARATERRGAGRSEPLIAI